MLEKVWVATPHQTLSILHVGTSLRPAFYTYPPKKEGYSLRIADTDTLPRVDGYHYSWLCYYASWMFC